MPQWRPVTRGILRWNWSCRQPRWGRALWPGDEHGPRARRTGRPWPFVGNGDPPCMTGGKDDWRKE